MLYEFIDENRDDILARAQSRVSARNQPPAAASGSPDGLPLFLEQVAAALRRSPLVEADAHAALKGSASILGGALFQEGLSVSQVIKGYGDLCQVITGLATERTVPISPGEFQTLNLCLDEATAGAVTSYSHQRERAISDEGTERLGVLAHNLRDVLNAVIMSIRMIKSGLVPTHGSTGAILDRNLIRMQTLIDRSMADVRLDAEIQNLERVPVWQLIEEVEIGASMLAQSMGLNFVVTSIDKGVAVQADRQILAAAVANLLQNAFKFTRKGTTVRLRASATESRVLIEIEDECGGLPVKKAETLLRPFVQKGKNRSGVGLGLTICLKAVKAIGGELRVKDLPHEGCVFTIDLPKQPSRVASVRPPRAKPKEVRTQSQTRRRSVSAASR
jgi:signal transduction histidine kinase